jgi:hypothetical protein
MATKRKLTELLSESEQSPAIKRGQGLRLSTEVSAPPTSDPKEGAISHDRTIAPANAKAVTRVNRGYKLREDLIKACKRLALETDRPLYEVMEAALIEYLERHGAQTPS